MWAKLSILPLVVVLSLVSRHSDSLSQLSQLSRTVRGSDAGLPGRAKTGLCASFAETFLKDDPYSIATLLLGTLLERRATDTDFSTEGVMMRLKPDFKVKQDRQQRRIEEYIKLLSEIPNNTYDPSKCLLGPLYCTLFSFSPSNRNQRPPLWEQISLKAENLKGQQYFLNSYFELSVVNYAQIWGRAFAIRARATFAPIISNGATSKNQERDKLPAFSLNGKQEKQFRKSSIINRDKSPEIALRSCPDRFVFRTYAAEFQFGGSTTVVVPIPIEGTAELVVLYADPRLRILTTPTGSESIVGAWEQTGLVVVQVHSGLITPDSVPLDLR